MKSAMKTFRLYLKYGHTLDVRAEELSMRRDTVNDQYIEYEFTGLEQKFGLDTGRIIGVLPTAIIAWERIK